MLSQIHNECAWQWRYCHGTLISVVQGSAGYESESGESSDRQTEDSRIKVSVCHTLAKHHSSFQTSIMDRHP